MLTQSTTLVLILLVGSLTTSVTGHWKKKESKFGGSHGHLMGTRGEMCPPGTRLMVATNSPGLLTGNFAERCQPWNIEFASLHRPSNAFIQPNPASIHPVGLYQQPFPAASTGVIGHRWTGLNKPFVPKARCEPWNIEFASLHRPSNPFIQPNPASTHPVGLYQQPFPAASTGVIGQ